MPSDVSSAASYASTTISDLTIEDLLQEMDVRSPEDLRVSMLSTCRRLYDVAKKEGKIYLSQRYAGTINEFIVCDSNELPQTLVNFGHGSCALSIVDELGPDAFLFIFQDKVPERYFPIVAAHESVELYEHRRGAGLAEGHIAGTRAELLSARDLGMEREYLAFIRERYPGKYPEINDVRKSLPVRRSARRRQVR